MSTNIPNQQSSTSQEDHDRKKFEIKKHDLRNQFNILVFNNTLSPQEDKKDVLPVVSKNIKVRNEKNQFHHKKSPKLGQTRYKYPVNEKKAMIGAIGMNFIIVQRMEKWRNGTLFESQ